MASAQANEEYRLKAAFLFNFTRFVEWPSQEFKNARDPISICIVGKNPFGMALADSLRGKESQDRPLELRMVGTAEQAVTCQLVFVASSERKRSRAILEALAGRGILTVGESESFTSEGGVVNLKLDDDKVHIQINPEAAEQQHVRISSKLMGLAEIVRPNR